MLALFLSQLIVFAFLATIIFALNKLFPVEATHKKAVKPKKV